MNKYLSMSLILFLLLGIANAVSLTANKSIVPSEQPILFNATWTNGTAPFSVVFYQNYTSDCGFNSTYLHTGFTSNYSYTLKQVVVGNAWYCAYLTGTSSNQSQVIGWSPTIFVAATNALTTLSTSSIPTSINTNTKSTSTIASNTTGNFTPSIAESILTNWKRVIIGIFIIIIIILFYLYFVRAKPKVSA